MEGINILKDFISYQEGAVVSRELIRKTGGSITLFAFAQGQRLSEHTTPYDAFVLIIDGEAEFAIDKKKFHLGEGETFIMPANHPHTVKAIKPFKMLLAMIRV